MEHLATVHSGDCLVTQFKHELLGDAVFFCNNNAKVGDVCVIKESYESLTGTEQHSTIMTWVKQKEEMQ